MSVFAPRKHVSRDHQQGSSIFLRNPPSPERRFFPSIPFRFRLRLATLRPFLSERPLALNWSGGRWVLLGAGVGTRGILKRWSWLVSQVCWVYLSFHTLDSFFPVLCPIDFLRLKKEDIDRAALISPSLVSSVYKYQFSNGADLFSSKLGVS